MDVDFDLKTSFNPKDVFPSAIRASVVNSNKELAPHACGYYLQNIAVDPDTGLAAIPYEQAEDVGYEKIDFLHLSVLDQIQKNEHIDAMIETEPDWELLQDPSVVRQLFHLGTIDAEGKLKHWDTIKQVKPRSVEDVADILALIRPGKRGLLPNYLEDKEKTRRYLYKDTGDQYYFKKSHAISYALNIVIQLHLIKMGYVL